jgi:hypothetical protein
VLEIRVVFEVSDAVEVVTSVGIRVQGSDTGVPSSLSSEPDVSAAFGAGRVRWQRRPRIVALLGESA